MDLGFKDRIVLITGSSRSIGKTIAETFAKEGATVVLNDVLKDVLDNTVNEFRDKGYKAYGYCFDITDQQAAVAAVDRIEAEVGPISVLINNAGITKRHPLEDFPLNEWQQVLNVDVNGAFIMSQAVAKKFIERRYGRIVSITSINAEMSRQTISAYCSAKGALKSLTKSMATEWGKYGITANAVGPGYVITDLNRTLAEDESFSAWVKSEVPLQRWGEIQEIANAVVFLASDKASYISGHTIYVDGGWQACL